MPDPAVVIRLPVGLAWMMARAMTHARRLSTIGDQSVHDMISGEGDRSPLIGQVVLLRLRTSVHRARVRHRYLPSIVLAVDSPRVNLLSYDLDSQILQIFAISYYPRCDVHPSDSRIFRLPTPQDMVIAFFAHCSHHQDLPLFYSYGIPQPAAMLRWFEHRMDQITIFLRRTYQRRGLNLCVDCGRYTPGDDAVRMPMAGYQCCDHYYLCIRCGADRLVPGPFQCPGCFAMVTTVHSFPPR